ncbi:MAG: T9SS type A sorting domain-containing protein [Lewinellaceae bacterium]|nr:T9SS type A sorting domain-containing protein [Lewinellaceae bacterium]
MPDPGAEPGALRLFDQQGKVVLQKRMTGAEGKLDMRGLPAGVYWYEWSEKKRKYRGKIVHLP